MLAPWADHKHEEGDRTWNDKIQHWKAKLAEAESATGDAGMRRQVNILHFSFQLASTLIERGTFIFLQSRLPSLWH